MTTQNSRIIKAVILDTDNVSANALKAIIMMHPDVKDVQVVSKTDDANFAFKSNHFNSLFIDIFSMGTEVGIEFIKHVRSNYPTVPICLYSPSRMLHTLPNVEQYWRNQFKHYYQLPKDIEIKGLESISQNILRDFIKYIEGETARIRLSRLRIQLSQSMDNITQQQKQEIEEVAAIAEKALESKDIKPQFRPAVVPGIKTEQTEQLVHETLRQAQNSLQTTTRVNIGVLSTGSLLVIISFFAAVITNRWEAVAFGGFGIAGIIASLITNPLKSISASARRLVQVQVAYLSFLSQLAILNRESNVITTIEQSKQLGDEMVRTLKALEEHFGN